MSTESSPPNQPKTGDDEENSFQWTTAAIVQSIAIFILAGFAEIIGGWLVWAAVKGIRVENSSESNVNQSGLERNGDSTNATNQYDAANLNGVDSDISSDSSNYTIIKKPWYYALLGSLTLVAYGFIPCLQPSAASDGFARIYAAYGGFFIILSFLLGWALEGESARPDAGDLVGGAICLVGVFVIMFWPNRGE